MRLPSSLIHTFSQGRGSGAGPEVTVPSRRNVLPWQGHTISPVSAFQVDRHPR